jgi:thioesterase domain-containing protein/acyl carrier protein
VLRAGKPARLLNVYGPTESTTFATWHQVDRLDDGAASVPIGRPVANTTVYVLDEGRQLVPGGVGGELCLGGDGLATGYLHRPDLTAERFVPHPFVEGARLYRTGDGARWRVDGTLEFLGRLDRQVKLRGHRIEPGEIEAALATHPDVHACAIAVDDSLAHRRLVAYVVHTRGSSRSPASLMAHLRKRLPDYMVPAVFVDLPALPLTTNGKLDVRALPTPEDRSRKAAGHQADRLLTDTEARLLRLWQDVLRSEDVGPADSFFSSGGHSLLAVQLVARIEDAFGITLPLSRFFEHDSVEALARVLDGSRHVDPWTPLVPLRPTGSRNPLFLVHGIGGEVVSFANLAVRLPADQPVLGIQAAGPGSDLDMPVEIEALAQRYVEVVTAADPSGPYYVGGYSSGAVVALEIARRLEAQGKRVALLLIIDGGLPRAALPAGRSRHTPASLARQMAYWVVDDALATRLQDWGPRLTSKTRSIARRLPFRRNGTSGGGDIRDDLGMWRFPERYRDLLLERYEAFRRHKPKPYGGRVSLVRSRTGRMLAPPSMVLDRAWASLVTGPFSVTYVRGSHMNVLAEPWVNELAAAVADQIARAREAQRTP